MVLTVQLYMFLMVIIHFYYSFTCWKRMEQMAHFFILNVAPKHEAGV